ncbi:MAG: DUF433 domain-containing protein [Chloroflexi bacterium]|nr:DUF433 domain-containing protein [Chloroflexota bacterium]
MDAQERKIVSMRAKNGHALAEMAAILRTQISNVKSEWADLKRRGLLVTRAGQVRISPWAMRRARNDLQRRMASHLSGYDLTENSFIVKRRGGKTYILNTRIPVEYIANYFEEGWGVTQIQQDLPLLTRDEIEAAIQYYLNHRPEIRREMEQSVKVYNAHASAWEHA